MAGRHARPSPARPRTGIIAAAAVAVALAAGGTAGMAHLSQTPSAADSGGQPTHAASDPAASATPTSSPLPERSAERASRGDRSTPSATPTAAPSPTRAAAPSPTRTAASSPSKTASGNVVARGTCGASFYYEPQPTASGERFDPEALTAAHKTWAFNTRVKVTNPANGKSVVVRINDRGPYIDGRCLDLSRAAFRAIADLNLGVINVRYEILTP
ncbi:MAG TPA: septal ring lytic transglycosylase RlpA family protein [Micromonosporaceae bacterium]|nr:septal ring lytic transglycosylase RlpA family protein [Micromonosporaceae bacterium]